MFTKLRFQSRSKIFWNRWSIKQYAITVRQARNQGGNLGIGPPEIFKTLHSNFDICRNFQRIKMKFYIIIMFKKSYWNFSSSYW